MSSRLRNLIGAFGVSITLWMLIIHGSISMLQAHDRGVDYATLASVK